MTLEILLLAIAWGEDTPPAWTEIEGEPQTYYDTTRFVLPFTLRAPNLLGVGKGVLLAEYFAAAPEPFVFRGRAEVEEIKAKQAKDLSKFGLEGTSPASPVLPAHGELHRVRSSAADDFDRHLTVERRPPSSLM